MRTSRFRLLLCLATTSVALAPALLLSSASETGPSAGRGGQVAATEDRLGQAGLPPQALLEPASLPDGAKAVVLVSRRSAFVWPAAGNITSYFGPGHTRGIDIGLGGGDSPVLASAGGTVSFVGGSACCDFGLHVVIEHDDGRSTLYGHLSRFRVAVGDSVEQGQVVGLGGSTGLVDGKHLHFELSDGGDLVDPLRYLPPDQELAGEGDEVDCAVAPILVSPASLVRVDFGRAATDGPSLRDALLTAGAGAPPGEATIAEDGALTIALPPAPLASGRTLAYRLQVVLAAAAGETDLECDLELATLTTLRNSENTAARLRAQAAARAATPRPTFTLTPTPRRPTPAPTWTPIPSHTPRPNLPAAPTLAPPRGPTPRP